MHTLITTPSYWDHIISVTWPYTQQNWGEFVARRQEVSVPNVSAKFEVDSFIGSEIHFCIYRPVYKHASSEDITGTNCSLSAYSLNWPQCSASAKTKTASPNNKYLHIQLHKSVLEFYTQLYYQEQHKKVTTWVISCYQHNIDKTSVTSTKEVMFSII